MPVWDLPSRWCPEEIRKNVSSSSGAVPVLGISVNSTALASGEDEPEDTLQSRGGDEDSGSESDLSEVGWDGALGSESRLWSRAAVEGGLVLVRRVQSSVDVTSNSTAENAELESATYCLALSAAHFSTEMISAGSDALLDRRLAEVLKERAPTWAVCALRSGHFAGAVFKGTEAVIHKALHRYTIRAKSGGSQAAQDSTGKKTKSAGSTLRRHGQQRLAEEIQELMTDKWSGELAACDIIFVSVSKRMRATLLGTERKPFVPFSKVRRLPFMVGKPTFEAIRDAHFRVAGVVFADEATTDILEKPFRPVVKPSPPIASSNFTPPARLAEEKEAGEHAPEVKYREEDDELFTPLHMAALANDEEKIQEILDGGADPTLRDGKGRVPYYLCSNQRGRDAFRRWRGANEDEWDWNQAQVPEGITEDSEQRKKDKEKEKKRRQREKQKASRQQSKEEEDERQKKAAEELKALEAAQAKCEFCKKPITSKPFTSNNFMYCSTACVSGHRRELQLEAALKRSS